MVRLIPFAWLLLFVAAPCLLVAGIAFAPAAEGVPPFVWPGFSLEAWRTLTADDFYLRAFLRSLRVAFLTAALCLALAYPMALALARAPARWQALLLGAVLLPFWTGFLLRVAAWIGLLRDEGWLNHMLQALGLASEPVPMLYTQFSMLLGLVHAYLPFAVLPLYATLLRLDRGLEEAAADLGASRWAVFRTVTLPLSAPGAAAAFLLVFIPAAGEYVVPELLGPPEAQLVGRVLWGEFFQNRDWPLAALLALLLLALLIMPMRLFQRLDAASDDRSDARPGGLNRMRKR
jgi:putrescine transport system permease protein